MSDCGGSGGGSWGGGSVENVSIGSFGSGDGPAFIIKGIVRYLVEILISGRRHAAAAPGHRLP